MMILGQPIVQLDGPEHDDSIKTRKKIAIFGVGAIALLVGFYTYASYMATQNYRQVELEAEKAQQEYQKIKQDRIESGQNPDFNNSKGEVFEITGYYQQETRSAWGETEECDILLIKSGTASFISKYTRLVKSGNGINRINENEELLFNLDLSNLTTIKKERILNSSESNQVSLAVKEKNIGDMGVPACYSFVDIIEVKPLKEDQVCIQVITSARNKETSEVKDFPTPCDVPEGWEKL